MRYFMKIQYVGTDFSGFQVQPGRRTVQGELCAALKKAFGAPCAVTGCSRTDAGVHAKEFCLTADTDGADIPPAKIPVAVAPFLPPDISVTFAQACPSDFHPRHDVVSKEYLYRIHNTPIATPFERNRVWQLNRRISPEGLERMKNAAGYFVGTHDFSAFMAEGSDVKDAHRTVHACSVKREGDLIEIRVSADGFLYNMVRIIVGTLVAVGFGRIQPDDLPQIIASGNRVRAGMTAPPDGLYLNRVSYTEKLV